MILTVPLQPGTLLANVRYKWLANGVISGVLTVGISQPDVSYPVFRFDVTPPAGAEEFVVFDVTNLTNWNVAEYKLVVLTTPTGTNLSPNLQRLRLLAAAYLRVDPSEFLFGGADLFLVAVNNARRQAELMHDFEYSRIVATLDIVPSGASLNDAVIVDGEAVAGVKAVTGIRRLGTNGYFYPLDFTRWSIAQERDRSALELRDDYWTILRYPSDADILNFYGTNAGIVQRGRKLFLYPGFSGQDQQSVTLYIDGYGWLSAYGSDSIVASPEDFIVERGFSYLQWATVCELNKMFASFVPRQEGNLTEPTKERDDAFRQLVLWDDYLTTEGLTRTS